MVELRDYFEPGNNELKKNRYAEGTYGKACQSLEWIDEDQQIQIAIIGIPETRNAFGGSFEANVDIIRSYFYQLAEIPRLKVVDLGDLKLGKLVKDTYTSVRDVVQELLDKNIIPIIIGGSQDLTVPTKACLNKQKEIELTIIDSRFDTNDNEFHSQSYLNQITKEFQQKVLISMLAYQSYFVPANAMRRAYDNNWNLHRLGLVRNNFNQIEPIFRDSDLVSFDISSIRQNDCPAASLLSPNGLYAEEACQLANLAGLSDKLKAFSVFECQTENDIKGQSAHLVAQIIWHFVYGISQRKNDFPYMNIDAYKKIFVKLDKIDSDLVFYENQLNKRFWVEIPTGKDNKTKLISCSESDYQKACHNEIPDRIWQNISRYLK